MPFRVVPVLDVKQGVAVRAVAGARAHYRPIASVLHPGSDPLLLAQALGDRFGFRELYLADLDAIGGAEPNESLYRDIGACGLSPWVDAGVRDAGSLAPLLRLRAGVATVVAGLETLRGPDALGAVADRVGADRVIFSLDLRAGVPIIAPGADWGEADPLAIAGRVLRLGIRRVLLLDLARVGMGEGFGTLPLAAELQALGAEVVVGGGVSHTKDIDAARIAGASAVLVGSALHDGRIGTAELAAVASS